ncbi:uncharacterized protein LOC110426974 isoform X2 [Herrania umbratica]|uniref:Uncharacterized protein LOC110426974 isoform X2 n=1 Tax=Herrania umbratica TaxID=108875 RepID=A0A6J1BFC8_9ROSI|nr:uncharacterized protein LOC110426974 isoform X2 [Herrania umbratica]
MQIPEKGHSCSRLFSNDQPNLDDIPLVPFACPSSFMGCGVSKFDIADDGEAASSQTRRFRPVHPRNDRAVVDSSLFCKPLPEGGKEGEHAVGEIQEINVKKENSAAKGGIQMEKVKKEEACDKEDCKEDDCGFYPRSPSFREYCILSESDGDNSEGDSAAGKLKDKRQRNVRNSNKGSRTRLGKRERIGKGIRTGSAKVKRILRV